VSAERPEEPNVRTPISHQKESVFCQTESCWFEPLEAHRYSAFAACDTSADMPPSLPSSAALAVRSFFETSQSKIAIVQSLKLFKQRMSFSASDRLIWIP
jgi:hypothetical protein